MLGQEIEVTQRAQALRGYFKSYSIMPNQEYQDPNVFLLDVSQSLTPVLRQEIETGIKLQLRVCVRFLKELDPDTELEAHFNNKQRELLQSSNIPNVLKGISIEIAQKIEDFQETGSGWIIDQILESAAHIAKFNPVRGSSYIPLPEDLAKKKAVVNVQNQDQLCFCWAVLSALYPAKHHSDRISNYELYLSSLRLEQIDFPISFDGISKFEFLNDLSISVYGYSDEKCEVFPMRQPKMINSRKHINLLYLENGTTKHYCWIKNLDRLLFTKNRHKNRKFFCYRCLRAFYREDQRDNHQLECTNDSLQEVCMPDAEYATMQFKNVQKQLRVPVVVYADFECILRGIPSCLPNPSCSFTAAVQKHVPCGAAYMCVEQCCENQERQIGNVWLDRSENCVASFLNQIVRLSESHVKRIEDREKGIKMRREEWFEHYRQNRCHVCSLPLNGDSVRDHCHLCGRYRGASHSSCNLKLQVKPEVVVIFHNLRRYDGHLIMTEIGKVAVECGLQIACIPRGMEDYISFSLASPRITVRFIDSFQFLNASLGTLAQNLLTKGEEHFAAVQKHFPANYQLLLKKGVYPYEYMDSMERFDELCLPPVDKFYSSLTGRHCSSSEYEHALQVWKTFHIPNLGCYHDLYLKTDVLLLSDIFENFRHFGMHHYQLDPCNYPTLPSYGWDACLRMSNVKLELCTDVEMYSFFELGIRGGISMITKRHAEANNPYTDDFDATKESSYIMYWDMNNLYGYTMTFKLPVRDFRWMSIQELQAIDWKTVDEHGNQGYILEVDLGYPCQLHDRHNDYPLAPEKLQVSIEMLSEEQRATFATENSYSEKLTPNLYDKGRYIVHYRNLKYYLSKGLELHKIHRGIKFYQEAWMQDYIMFNTRMRKDAKSEFEKDLFKLLNNSVFGKSMENVRNYVKVELVTSTSRANKMIASPFFHSYTEFSEDLVAVKMLREKVFLNKPIYIGFTVLDLSKLLMYQFHYDYVGEKYGSRAKLLFTDTDSLCYEIFTADVYADMHEDIHLFDTSNYPNASILHSQHNMKVMGKMKDEAAGRVVKEFVGLRAKMYSIKIKAACDQDDDFVEKMRAKGVTGAVMRKELRHSDYRRVLFEGVITRHLMHFIRSNKHVVETMVVNKVGLSGNDDKRYFKNRVETLAHGHYAIMQEQAINISN